MMEHYVHNPLREPWGSHRQIRVLTLRCGAPEDRIQVGLSTHTIEDNATVARDAYAVSVQWEALSYTWGDKQNTHTILIERAGSGPANFDTQIANYDAICMDQDDTEQARQERAWQIPAMLEIYSMASRVVTWLGEESNDSDFAMQFLKQLGEGFDFDWNTYEMSGSAKLQSGVLTFLHKYEQYFAHGMRQYNAVCALLERDWFTRVWIRQEAFAAAANSVIACGSVSIPVHDFRNAMQILGERGLDVRDPKFELHSARLSLAIAIFEKATTPILHFLDRVRSSNCKYPVDKVYGCLGMIKMIAGVDFVSRIEMAHKKPLALYKDFFHTYTTYYGQLNLLEAAGLYQRSELDGPSWMPDWTTPSQRLFPSDLENAVSHAMAADATFENGDVLRVHGVMADTIASIGTMDYSEDVSDQHWPTAYAALAKLITSHLEGDDLDQLDDFIRAFLYPLKGHRIPIEDVLRRRTDYEVFVKAVWAGKDPKTAMADPDPQSFSHFQTCLRWHEKAQLPFLFTRKGHIGIGTKGAKRGDLVTAVLGSQSLLILRPYSETTKPKQYRMVGTCSVHGYSTGKALLGPLPAETTIISRLDQGTGTYRRYFEDVNIGNTTFWDPRIDWEELITDETPSWKINPPPGELERNVPTAEYFRRHGVGIVSFDLV